MSNPLEPSLETKVALKEFHDATAPAREAAQRLRDAAAPARDAAERVPDGITKPVGIGKQP